MSELAEPGGGSVTRYCSAPPRSRPSTIQPRPCARTGSGAPRPPSSVKFQAASGDDRDPARRVVEQASRTDQAERAGRLPGGAQRDIEPPFRRAAQVHLVGQVERALHAGPAPPDAQAHDRQREQGKRQDGVPGQENHGLAFGGGNSAEAATGVPGGQVPSDQRDAGCSRRRIRFQHSHRTSSHGTIGHDTPLMRAAEQQGDGLPPAPGRGRVGRTGGDDPATAPGLPPGNGAAGGRGLRRSGRPRGGRRAENRDPWSGAKMGVLGG